MGGVMCVNVVLNLTSVRRTALRSATSALQEQVGLAVCENVDSATSAQEIGIGLVVSSNID